MNEAELKATIKRLDSMAKRVDRVLERERGEPMPRLEQLGQVVQLEQLGQVGHVEQVEPEPLVGRELEITPQIRERYRRRPRVSSSGYSPVCDCENEISGDGDVMEEIFKHFNEEFDRMVQAHKEA